MTFGKPGRGFTLFELMIVTVILAILTPGVARMLSTGRNDVRRRDAPLIWSGQARAALTSMARDARQVGGVAVVGGDLVIDHARAPGGRVVYRLEKGEGRSEQVLVRRSAGMRNVLATDLTELRLATAAGRLHVTLEFAASFGDYTAAASHATTVALPGSYGGRR